MYSDACTILCFLRPPSISLFFFFFFNDTATTEIYTLSLHDALPILTRSASGPSSAKAIWKRSSCMSRSIPTGPLRRSEEHTSELQSRRDLVCRLLLEKKKKKKKQNDHVKTNI